jgi:hypothetical protein
VAPPPSADDLGQCGARRGAGKSKLCGKKSPARLSIATSNSPSSHALVFACRRISGGWINAQTRARLDVRPTHWRDWPPQEAQRAAASR